MNFRFIFLITLSVLLGPSLASACQGRVKLSGNGRCFKTSDKMIALDQCGFQPGQTVHVSATGYNTDPADSVSVTIKEIHHNRFYALVSVGGIHQGEVCAETGFDWTAVAD